jgi:hypothetical protein
MNDSPPLHPSLTREGRDAIYPLSTRLKMRAAQLGKKLTAEHKRKIAKALKGKRNAVGVRSEQTRARMAEAHRGLKLSPQHKRNISAAMKARVR